MNPGVTLPPRSRFRWVKSVRHWRLEPCSDYVSRYVMDSRPWEATLVKWGTTCPSVKMHVPECYWEQKTFQPESKASCKWEVALAGSRGLRKRVKTVNEETWEQARNVENRWTLWDRVKNKLERDDSRWRAKYPSLWLTNQDRGKSTFVKEWQNQSKMNPFLFLSNSCCIGVTTTFPERRI